MKIVDLCKWYIEKHTDLTCLHKVNRERLTIFDTMEDMKSGAFIVTREGKTILYQEGNRRRVEYYPIKAPKWVVNEMAKRMKDGAQFPSIVEQSG